MGQPIPGRPVPCDPRGAQMQRPFHIADDGSAHY
jgi:hypothetical protein